MKSPLQDARQFNEEEAYNKNLTASARLHYLENERHDAPGKMMGKSPTKMKYESASQERSNLLSMNPLSKHMSTPLNMYKNSPAQMANSAMKMSDKSAMKMAESPVKMDGKSLPKEKYGKSHKSLKPNKSQSAISKAGDKLKAVGNKMSNIGTRMDSFVRKNIYGNG